MDKEDVAYIHTHIYNGIFLSTKKNEIMLFAVTWMDLERDYHTKWSKPKTNIIWCCLYAESKKKKDTNELKYKTEINPQM